MKFLILSAALLFGNPLTEAKPSAPCEQIDRLNQDYDGVPFCPGIVKTNTAYSVFRCAFAQSKSWHAPTDKEKQNMKTLIQSFEEDAKLKFMLNASELGLQTCRVKKKREFNGREEDDSYLLVYTRPGVKDYSGPFLMLREVNASKTVILSPHDATDGTHLDTKIAFEKSHARILISNGHHKSKGDFVKSSNTLGFFAMQEIENLFPQSVWLMFHGQANYKNVLFRARNKALGNAFEKAVRKYTYIKEFKSFNAWYVTDNLVKSAFYLKTEIPAKIHARDQEAVGEIVNAIETNAWAWPTHK